MEAWITSIGGYLPNLRLDRAKAAREFSWSGLPLPRRGSRAVAGWDEDPLTMAVEAARGPAGGATPQRLDFASTSAFFTDRAQSAIMLDALALPRGVRTCDLANSRRSGSSALLDALLAGRDALVAAAEKRDVQPGNPSQLAFGDGGAAVRTGAQGSARLIGHASITHDLVDRYASREHPTSYAYEERFVRDVAVGNLLIPAIREACEAAGIEPGAIAGAAVAEPVDGCWSAVARKLGIAAPNSCEEVRSAVGDLGTAHCLYGLGLALDGAEAGQIVLLAGFGSGVDALLFEVTGATPGAAEMAAALREGAMLDSITRFLSLTGGMDVDWGMRSEFAQKAQATVLERVGRDMIGFVGGRDSSGSVQFPKSDIPVNPTLHAVEKMEDVRLADETATIVSVTADRLNFTPDPPFDFGLVQFDNGARVLMEMTDRPDGGFAVGQAVRMRLRIKSQNKALGFRTYFWKAAPIARNRLGDD